VVHVGPVSAAEFGHNSGNGLRVERWCLKQFGLLQVGVEGFDIESAPVAVEVIVIFYPKNGSRNILAGNSKISDGSILNFNLGKPFLTLTLV